MSYSLYLFGSYARGDYDQSSDIDILCINHECSNEEEQEKKKYLQQFDLNKISLSSYNKENIEKYYENGHLFSWHLFYESRHLISSDDDILKKYGSPNKYINYFDDLNDFIVLVSDIRKKVMKRNTGFEACNLYTAIRNISFFYVYKNMHEMDFSPYSLYKRHISFPITIEKYKKYKDVKSSRTIGEIDERSVCFEDIKNDAMNLHKWIKENRINGKL